MSIIITRPISLNYFQMNYPCISLLLLFLCSFISIKASAAKLTITDNLIVRDIDDKPVEQGFLSKNQVFTLIQGQHALVVKYKDVFEDLDFGEEKLVKSDYFVVKFTVENQQELLLTTIEINDLATAERFVKSPELSMFDEDQQNVVLDLEQLSDYALAKQVTKVVTTLSAPAVVPQSNSKATNLTKIDQSFNNQVINNVDTIPMLKYWWQKANKDERESFINFINKNKEQK